MLKRDSQFGDMNLLLKQLRPALKTGIHFSFLQEIRKPEL